VPEAGYTNDELMAIEAARHLRDGAVCFVGIGLPSTAANLARLTHAPNIVLIYESGTIGTRPHVLPLSIGDGELAETADAVVSVPEIFAYWLQGGRIDVGFLGGAQIDRFGNLNTTVISDYKRPRTRLPGAGGAPEIATSAKEVLIIMKQDKRSFVEQLDFVTTMGYGQGADTRERLGAPGAGPTRVITNFGVFEPAPKTKELTLVQLHPGVDVDQVQAATGWTLSVAPELTRTPEPAAETLAVLRDLRARTAAAHSGA
jgi:glutaconate CoA-transferase, subunit B